MPYSVWFQHNLSVNVGIFSEEHLQYHYLQEGKVKDIRVLVINEKKSKHKFMQMELYQLIKGLVSKKQFQFTMEYEMNMAWKNVLQRQEYKNGSFHEE